MIINPVPFPHTAWEWFWLVYRAGVPIVCVFIVAWMLSIFRQMLNRMEAERIERSKHLDEQLAEVKRMAAETKRMADELAKKTDTDLQETKERDAGLSQQISDNTDLTRAAATAAKDAYHEANNVNEKIAKTNEHLEKVLSSKTDGIQADPIVREKLEQIEQHTAEVAANTKK